MEAETPVSADRRLVQAVLAGRPGAFERLVREHQALCWHVIHRMVRHPEDARELCQDTFLRVHQRLHQFRGESSLKSWIGRVAYSIAVRHLQRKRLPIAQDGPSEDAPPLAESVPADVDVEARHEAEADSARLLAAIEALPPQQRAVLMLYHLDELSIADIASITGLAEGTIKSQLFRTRLQLRDLLTKSTGVAS